jgi:hypothetical protein
MAVPCQHPEFIGSRVEAHQISVAGAFQSSSPQWPRHKSVGQPFVFIGTCNFKLIPMPREMPLKIIAVFKRHGVGNVPKLHISREMDSRAWFVKASSLIVIIARQCPNCYFADYSRYSPLRGGLFAGGVGIREVTDVVNLLGNFQCGLRKGRRARSRPEGRLYPYVWPPARAQKEAGSNTILAVDAPEGQDQNGANAMGRFESALHSKTPGDSLRDPERHTGSLTS